MIEIVPAILPKSLEDLQQHLLLIDGAAREVQIDVVDGVFAPNTTWGLGEDDDFQTFKSAFDFEMDLMVNDAEDLAQSWQKKGAARVLIHIDSAEAREALMAMRFEEKEAEIKGAAAAYGGRGPAPLVGLALPSTASIDRLKEFENLFDYIQVMGIEKVGFQGQPFDSRSIDLVRVLRRQFPDLTIQVDGAVSDKNIPELVAAGAQRLIVGSAIWKSKNPKEEIQRLKRLANNKI